MRVNEVENDPQTEKLAALSQFLLGQAQDNNTQLSISIDAFVKYANLIGIPVTPDNLSMLVNKDPLRNLIDNIDTDQGKIFFHGSMQIDKTDAMKHGGDSPKIVDKLAKRALGRR